MIRLIDGRGKGSDYIWNRLNRRSQLSSKNIQAAVNHILEQVQQLGDTAVLGFTSQFDGVAFQKPEDMIVSSDEINDAYQRVPSELIEIFRRAKEKILQFHIKQRTNTWMSFDEEDIILGQRIQPMERVGVYVPGGRAAYPSSVLMNVLPAKVAGVPEIVMVTPPQAPDGKVNDNTLVAAHEAGVSKIYKVGGAQAIGALAFGTSVIPKVDKIVGPGNIYVALAKKAVYGYVDIDMIAGPSEVLIVADASANPAYVAADLMSQAEHDPMASALLITSSIELAERVKSELIKQIQKMSTRETILASLKEYGALIVVDTIEDALELSNRLAPEHLELAVENAFEYLGKVKHAGAIFLGHYTPEPVGDYMAGPNHVLPTGGTARFFSPLGVEDFVKKSSIISYTPNALKGIYKDISLFARAEGLEAHANSVEVRFKDDEGVFT